ncbi:Blue (type 1) copper protein, binding site [Parasponia andersonii]|uniref:Blue (Type 1) copper protein, binding site n=1 Tax=Parasponia andersonii TaxID=3476 RepID=A0A2P5CQ70_PARAD|nr:Blue (type 1) copper protein, binding site [Parasponia andersonii]
MARKLNIFLFAALAAVAMLQSSAVATTFFVGDSANWVIPSSPNFYSNWAANKTFKVGDILVFNFVSTQHNVAEVTKANYDACNGASPISIQTSSPVNITLQKTGEHYYICTVGSHCSAGQKLDINVTGASSPAPQPSSPSPSSSPSPVPARTPAPAPKTSSPSPVPAPALTPEPSSTPSPSAASPPPSGTPTSPSPKTSSPSPVPAPALAPEPSSTPSPSTASPPPSGTPTSPSPGDSTTSSPPPPPSNSGANSLGVAGLSATFLSLVALAL